MLGMFSKKKAAVLAASLLWSGTATVGLAKQLVVKIGPDTDFKTAVAQFKARADVQVRDTHTSGRLVLLTVKDNQTDSLKKNFLSSFEYAVENIKFHAFSTPNDPNIDKQWALKKVQASKAWEHTTGSKDIIVAVIDTGINWKHEDLKTAIWTNPNEIAGNNKDDDGNGFVDDVRGWDFHGNDNDPDDETSSRNPGHGTHCAGIVGAVGDNGVGISGMSQKVRLMPIRFLGADGSGDLMAAAKAIDYAVANGAQVISASWGAAVPRSGVGPILEAIERAEAKGVVFVAAAANDGKSNDTREVYPANAGFSNMISVAASNPSDAKPNWSNYGKQTVDLSSPGEDIFSTLPGNKYDKLSGTSMATPLVAGLVALMMSKAEKIGKTYNVADYKAILQASATKVEIETACDCRVDAAAAMEHMDKDALTIVPNAATVAEDGTLEFTAIGGSGPYSFVSSDASIAAITEDGQLTAKQKGQVTLTVTDKYGTTSESNPIYIGKETPTGGLCPLENELLCLLMCVIEPELPWCTP